MAEEHWRRASQSEGSGDVTTATGLAEDHVCRSPTVCSIGALRHVVGPKVERSFSHATDWHFLSVRSGFVRSHFRGQSSYQCSIPTPPIWCYVGPPLGLSKRGRPFHLAVASTPRNAGRGPKRRRGERGYSDQYFKTPRTPSRRATAHQKGCTI